MRELEIAKFWTKELVQEHAQVAAAVELYTLPFYITAMTSVIDQGSEACRIVRSVIAEEMLHLQLTANLCLALDARPHFKPPRYHSYIPYIQPYDEDTGSSGFLNATLGPLDDETLDTMLDIETPDELRLRQKVNHAAPQFPYSSIGEMYDALLVGIHQVGIEQFSWATAQQQQHWPAQAFPQIIGNYDDAQQAMQALMHQGEGCAFGDNLEPPPWNETSFPIPAEYQLRNDPSDPEPYNGYAHVGRFLKLKNSSLPDIYSGLEKPDDPIVRPLQQNFSLLLAKLNLLWTEGGSEGACRELSSLMQKIFANARSCWQAGVIPIWS